MIFRAVEKTWDVMRVWGRTKPALAHSLTPDFFDSIPSCIGSSPLCGDVRNNSRQRSYDLLRGRVLHSRESSDYGSLVECSMLGLLASALRGRVGLPAGRRLTRLGELSLCFRDFLVVHGNILAIVVQRILVHLTPKVAGFIGQ